MNRDSSKGFGCVRSAGLRPALGVRLQSRQPFCNSEHGLTLVRCKAGLAAAKQRGAVLGNPNPKASLRKANIVIQNRKQEFAKSALVTIREIKSAGVAKLARLQIASTSGAKRPHVAGLGRQRRSNGFSIVCGLRFMKTKLTDSSGKTRGYLEAVSRYRVVLQDASGKTLGFFNPHLDQTFKASGRMVGKGNLLASLFRQALNETNFNEQC